MLIQKFIFKGIPLISALKVTGVTATQGSKNDLYNVKVEINRYTDDTMDYDIEQISKTFVDIPNNSVDGITLFDLNNFDDLLLSLPEFK